MPNQITPVRPDDIEEGKVLDSVKSHDMGAGAGAGAGSGAHAKHRQFLAEKERADREPLKKVKSFAPFSFRQLRDTNNPTHVKIIKIIDGTIVSTVMTIATVYALFGDDLRLAAFPVAADPVFFSLSIVALVLFSAELILNSIAKKKYIWRFYFWLDLLSTLSLIPDIGWIWDPLVGNDDDSSTAASSGALRAGKASRASTKAGRIVRIVRLVRLIRIVKLYKHVGHKSDEKKQPHRRSSIPTTMDEPSQVGKTLSDLTTRRVIILVLVMVVCTPLFDTSTINGIVNQYQEDGLGAIHRLGFSVPSDVSMGSYRSSVEQYATLSGELLNMTLHGVSNAVLHTWLSEIQFVDYADDGTPTNMTVSPTSEWNADSLVSEATIADTFRSNELTRVYATGCYDTMGRFLISLDCASKATFSIKASTTLEAVLNMLKTVFVMLVLGVGAFMFTRDAETLVIGPIERMVEMVKQLSRNPLAAVSTSHETSSQHGYETALLETTLAKIGALLQIGFGEAGTEIIRQNMLSGNLQALVPGRKMHGVFGFCDIRQFTDATECLQQDVMIFVNRIGVIVHEATHQYWGAANKNIGDAFLLVWRAPDANTNLYSSSRLDLPVSQLCDNALFAFLKIMVDIEASNRETTSEALGLYASDSRIISRFGDNYSVKMGFGLHFGWAIEGAIGSRLKIDASYLSPNVNMASRLEAATKQYGVPLLLSDGFVDNCTVSAQSYLRVLDRVTVKGSAQPILLYTFDLVNYVPELGPTLRDTRCNANFATDPAIKALQEGLHPDFVRTFRRAVSAFRESKWQEAKQLLEQCQAFKPGDGPCDTLLDYMGASDFEAPSTFAGYRVLDSK